VPPSSHVLERRSRPAETGSALWLTDQATSQGVTDVGAAALHVGVLGPFEIRIGGVPTGPAGARRRGLLAVLALEVNEVVPVTELVDRVWGDDPPESSVNIVQTYVSAWRKVLGRETVATVGSGYRLSLTSEECDLLAFGELATRGRAADSVGHADEAAGLFGDALALWRGPALVDLSGEPFHQVLTAPLEAERLSVTESWARTALTSGADPTRVAATLAEVRTRDPLRESVTELLMWALTAAGQQAEALTAFDLTRRALRDDLGADPGPGLTAMHGRVLRGDPELQARTRAVTTAGPPPQHGARADSFVGRDRELGQVLGLLATHRLLTLTGAGGSGKTRLASEVLLRYAQGPGQGWFVDLSDVREPAAVPAAVAAAVGLQTAAGTDPLHALAEHLAGSDGLLVLDNLEHLPGVRSVVDALRRTTRELRLLTTSREPLRLAGEQQYPVPLLAVPLPDSTVSVAELQDVASVQLLVDRARAHQPDFAVTDENVADIARIARRLDGLPLAVEIVAPWLRMLTPADLAARLAGSLDLPDRRPDAPARHRTLRETIRWSYDMLPGDEQSLLCSLAVFAGGFTVAAVEGICTDLGPVVSGDVTEGLFNLVDRNLVQVMAASADERRFRLLQTVRDFSEEMGAAVLGPARGDLRMRHAQWYAGWCTQLAAHSEGPDSDRWLAAAVAEADNIRAAIDAHASREEVAAHLQVVVDAMTLWFEAGHEPEGEKRLADALARAGPDAPARAIGLTYWAWLRGTTNRPEAAAAAAEAFELARRDDDAPVEAFALQTLGDLLDDPARSAAASEAVFGAADRSQRTVIRYGPTAPDAVRCGASYNLAAVWLHRSVPTALSWQEEALRRAELEGDRRIIAVNAARLALVHLQTVEVDAARRHLARAMGLVSRRVTARWEDIVTFAAGQVAHHDGQRDEAEQYLTRVLRSASSAGRPLHTVLGAVALADLHTAGGRHQPALDVLALAQQRVERVADPSQLARLVVRRARLMRLVGQGTEASRLLATVAPTLAEDALPPERVVWLLETAAGALAAGDVGLAGQHVAGLDAASQATGVQLPPWEQRNLAELQAALDPASETLR
jgi:predicted ATPase/DNA-binding SARP family transcriptional activator